METKNRYEGDIKSKNKGALKLNIVGQKDFKNNGTWIENEKVREMLEERKAQIAENRFGRKQNLITAEWLPISKEIRVNRRITKYMDFFGHKNGSATYLYPEEALFLLENNKLQLLYNGLTMSVQRSYAVLLNKTDCTINEYRVFHHFALQGYKVFRHNEHILFSGLIEHNKQVAIEGQTIHLRATLIKDLKAAYNELLRHAPDQIENFALYFDGEPLHSASLEIILKDKNIVKQSNNNNVDTSKDEKHNYVVTVDSAAAEEEEEEEVEENNANNRENANSTGAGNSSDVTHNDNITKDAATGLMDTDTGFLIPTVLPSQVNNSSELDVITVENMQQQQQETLSHYQSLHYGQLYPPPSDTSMMQPPPLLLQHYPISSINAAHNNLAYTWYSPDQPPPFTSQAPVPPFQSNTNTRNDWWDKDVPVSHNLPISQVLQLPTQDFTENTGFSNTCFDSQFTQNSVIETPSEHANHFQISHWSLKNNGPTEQPYIAEHSLPIDNDTQHDRFEALRRKVGMKDPNFNLSSEYNRYRKKSKYINERRFNRENQLERDYYPPRLRNDRHQPCERRNETNNRNFPDVSYRYTGDSDGPNFRICEDMPSRYRDISRRRIPDDTMKNIPDEEIQVRRFKDILKSPLKNLLQKPLADKLEKLDTKSERPEVLIRRVEDVLRWPFGYLIRKPEYILSRSRELSGKLENMSSRLDDILKRPVKDILGRSVDISREPENILGRLKYMLRTPFEDLLRNPFKESSRMTEFSFLPSKFELRWKKFDNVENRSKRFSRKCPSPREISRYIDNVARELENESRRQKSLFKSSNVEPTYSKVTKSTFFNERNHSSNQDPLIYCENGCQNPRKELLPSADFIPLKKRRRIDYIALDKKYNTKDENEDDIVLVKYKNWGVNDEIVTIDNSDEDIDKSDKSKDSSSSMDTLAIIGNTIQKNNSNQPPLPLEVDLTGDSDIENSNDINSANLNERPNSICTGSKNHTMSNLEKKLFEQLFLAQYKNHTLCGNNCRIFRRKLKSCIHGRILLKNLNKGSPHWKEIYFLFKRKVGQNDNIMNPNVAQNHNSPRSCIEIGKSLSKFPNKRNSRWNEIYRLFQCKSRQKGNMDTNAVELRNPDKRLTEKRQRLKNLPICKAKNIRHLSGDPTCTENKYGSSIKVVNSFARLGKISENSKTQNTIEDSSNYLKIKDSAMTDKIEVISSGKQLLENEPGTCVTNIATVKSLNHVVTRLPKKGADNSISSRIAIEDELNISVNANLNRPLNENENCVKNATEGNKNRKVSTTEPVLSTTFEKRKADESFSIDGTAASCIAIDVDKATNLLKIGTIDKGDTLSEIDKNKHPKNHHGYIDYFKAYVDNFNSIFQRLSCCKFEQDVLDICIHAINSGICKQKMMNALRSYMLSKLQDVKLSNKNKSTTNTATTMDDSIHIDDAPDIQNEHYSSFAGIYKRLQIFSPIDYSKLKIDVVKSVKYDLYLPATSLHKSNPPYPDYRVIVVGLNENMPTMEELSKIYNKYEQKVCLLVAIVNSDSISLFRFENNTTLEVF